MPIVEHREYDLYACKYCGDTGTWHTYDLCVKHENEECLKNPEVVKKRIEMEGNCYHDTRRGHLIRLLKFHTEGNAMWYFEYDDIWYGEGGLRTHRCFDRHPLSQKDDMPVHYDLIDQEEFDTILRMQVKKHFGRVLGSECDV